MPLVNHAHSCFEGLFAGSFRDEHSTRNGDRKTSKILGCIARAPQHECNSGDAIVQ
jgi:hypothetical protein